ncbi:MAG: hypothetical protein HXX81_05785 [Campylobacterales bacterium]|nr:hypothetical protein [Campylobacterales bacterium]
MIKYLIVLLFFVYANGENRFAEIPVPEIEIMDSGYKNGADDMVFAPPKSKSSSSTKPTSTIQQPSAPLLPKEPTQLQTFKPDEQEVISPIEVENEPINVPKETQKPLEQSISLPKSDIEQNLKEFKQEEPKEQVEDVKLYSKIPNLVKQDSIKIALFVPKDKIGKYSSTSSTIIISYLLSKGINFEYEMFDVKNESEYSVKSAVESAISKGFRVAISLSTQDGINEMLKFANNFESIYIPTVNAHDVRNVEIANSVLFGGIDYKSQIAKLLKYANYKVSALFDDSNVGFNLTHELKKQSELNKEVIVSKNTTKFNSIINYSFTDSSVFLNTPVVKTSLLMSQFTYLKIKPYVFLSTQINYTPHLLTLTQYQDRDNFYVANSIKHSNLALSDMQKVLNVDINYDWINFSTIVGIDLLSASILDTNRVFDIHLKNKNINYPIEIYKASYSNFVKME